MKADDVALASEGDNDRLDTVKTPAEMKLAVENIRNENKAIIMTDTHVDIKEGLSTGVDTHRDDGVKELDTNSTAIGSEGKSEGLTENLVTVDNVPIDNSVTESTDRTGSRENDSLEETQKN